MHFGGPLAKADHFECDRAVEALLSRAVNHPLAAPADFLQQFVIAKVTEYSCGSRCSPLLSGDAGVHPPGRGRRPRLQIRYQAEQDFQEDRLGKLHLLRFQRFLLRMFRKLWWQSSLDLSAKYAKITPKLYTLSPVPESGRAELRPHSMSGFAAKPFVFIGVHSWLIFTLAAQRLGGALHRQYRREALRYGRLLRVRPGGTADVTGRTLASLRLQSFRIPLQCRPVKDDPVHL